MSPFYSLIQALICRLECANLHADWQSLTVELDHSASLTDGLAWLKGQSLFPQAFWLHRDHGYGFISLGAGLSFTELEPAAQFSQDYGMQLVGGIQFEGQIHFILPRLLFVKKGEKLSACCAVKGGEKDRVLHFLRQLAEAVPLNPLTDIQQITQQTAYPFTRWAENIHSAVKAIQAQAFDKVVLANATTFSFTQALSAYDLLYASSQKNHGCFHFLWSEEGTETFIGSSPERLYRREGRAFFTEALAGTVAVSDDPQQTEQNAHWLRNDPKNIYENWLVVDDICTHLADCTHDLEVGEVEIKRLRNVQHLRRPIHTTLTDSVSDADCLARIHPTAAVAGLPRAKAKAFIRQHEGFSRGWYAGSLGYFTPNEAEFCVTLRSALIRQNSLTVYAGAGIVAESEALSEWQEIQRKALAISSLIPTGKCLDIDTSLNDKD